MQELFSINEVAHRRHCSPTTVRRQILRGDLPAVKVEGKYLVPAAAVQNLTADIDALIERTTAASGVPFTVNDADVLRRVAAVLVDVADRQAAL